MVKKFPGLAPIQSLWLRYLICGICGIAFTGCGETKKESSRTVEQVKRTIKDKAPEPQTKEKMIDESTSLADEGSKAERKGEVGKALELYSKSIELNPENTYSLFHRGVIYYKGLEFRKTIEDLEKVNRLKPAWVHTSNLFLSEAYSETGEFEKANRLLIETYPEIEPVPAKEKALRLLAMNLKALKKYDQALKYLNQAIALNSNSQILLGDRVELYMALEENDKALEDLNVILKDENPGHKQCYLRAKLLVAKGEYEKAIEDLNKIIHPNTYNRNYLLLRIEAAKKSGNSKLVEADEKLLKKFDSISGPPGSMGEAYTQKKKK